MISLAPAPSIIRIEPSIISEGSLGIGILGYAPSVGQIHGLGASKTPGLSLQAVCDLNPKRLDQARQDFPGVKSYETAASFAEEADVDLVIVATPPNSHSQLSLQMMQAGKHVVCEKPLALNRRETDALVEMATKLNVHLSCHQNRRWDPDYLSIKQSLADHLLFGEPLAAPLSDSVKVVAILEAAARSMAQGGTVEVIDGGSD